MRISDWSSDVCSSDLAERRIGDEADAMFAADGQDFGLDLALPDRIFALQRGDRRGLRRAAPRVGAGLGERDVAHLALLDRSEERSVGQEWVSTCRTRW